MECMDCGEGGAEIHLRARTLGHPFSGIEQRFCDHIWSDDLVRGDGPRGASTELIGRRRRCTIGSFCLRISSVHHRIGFSPWTRRPQLLSNIQPSLHCQRPPRLFCRDLSAPWSPVFYVSHSASPPLKADVPHHTGAAQTRRGVIFVHGAGGDGPTY